MTEKSSPADNGFQRWNRLNQEWFEECVANPRKDWDTDFLFLEYEADADNSNDVICNIYAEHSDEEVCRPMSRAEVQNDMKAYIRWLERIIRCRPNNRPSRPEDYDPRACLNINHENLPDGIHGTITVFDVQEQKMLMKAYVETLEFVHYIYRGFLRFNEDEFEGSLDIHSPELDEFIRDWESNIEQEESNN